RGLGAPKPRGHEVTPLAKWHPTEGSEPAADGEAPGDRRRLGVSGEIDIETGTEPQEEVLRGVEHQRGEQIDREVRGRHASVDTRGKRVVVEVRARARERESDTRPHGHERGECDVVADARPDRERRRAPARYRRVVEADEATHRQIVDQEVVERWPQPERGRRARHARDVRVLDGETSVARDCDLPALTEGAGG